MALVLVSAVVDGVVTLTLRRPEKKNALSIALRDELSDTLDALSSDGSVKVVVLTGAGSVFSAGFDLSEFDDPAVWPSSDRFHHTVLRFPLPTIAAVNGAALAGGFDLAVLCDLRVAAEGAYFAHVEHTFGDVVYRPLRELVGAGVARDLVLTGRRIQAREALALGLVNRVVPEERLLDEAASVAAEIALAPRDVLMRTKAKIIAAAGIDPDATTLEL
ncbi:MAG TPA: enoyl-CoA hydratase/isomerase family protein [Acidimicrobiales bacterium]|nr:enoyl-CoA hydratase/isomerase family protein [Acidimicrobiales bacterium]